MNTITAEKRAEIFAHFDDSQVAFLATGRNGQPRVRPITVVTIDGAHYIFTGAESAKVEELNGNDRFELCVMKPAGENNLYVRLAGRAEIITDGGRKSEMAKKCRFFDRFWKSPEDPDYCLIALHFEIVEYMPPGEMFAEKYRI